MSLAHHGVLFLDEMLEFSRHVLEVLRQPLEEGRVDDRARGADGGLPRALHARRRDEPVSVRLLGDPSRECRCTPQQIARYRERLSGPLRDRLDLTVDVPALPLDVLTDGDARGESSAAVRERVVAARDPSGASGTPRDGIRTNAELTAVADGARTARSIATALRLLRRRGAEDCRSARAATIASARSRARSPTSPARIGSRPSTSPKRCSFDTWKAPDACTGHCLDDVIFERS